MGSFVEGLAIKGFGDWGSRLSSGGSFWSPGWGRSGSSLEIAWIFFCHFNFPESEVHHLKHSLWSNKFDIYVAVLIELGWILLLLCSKKQHQTSWGQEVGLGCKLDHPLVKVGPTYCFSKWNMLDPWFFSHLLWIWCWQPMHRLLLVLLLLYTQPVLVGQMVPSTSRLELIREWAIWRWTCSVSSRCYILYSHGQYDGCMIRKVSMVEF